MDRKPNFLGLQPIKLGFSKKSKSRHARDERINSKRLAVQIVAQLPPDKKKAKEVISDVMDLLENWLFADQPGTRASVVSFPRSLTARSSGAAERTPK